jgi:hypothetical protein
VGSAKTEVFLTPLAVADNVAAATQSGTVCFAVVSLALPNIQLINLPFQNVEFDYLGLWGI